MSFHRAAITSLRVPALGYHAGLAEVTGPVVIHAVFPHSLQLCSSNRTIVTVTDSRRNGPLSMRVAEGVLGNISPIPGATGELMPDRLDLDTLVIDLRAASPWRPAPARRPVLALQLAVHTLGLQRAIVRTQRGGLGGWQLGEQSDDPAWLRRGRGVLVQLITALEDDDATSVACAATGLLGLGPGLTPSGDDVLCGLMVGLSVLGRRSPWHQRRCRGLIQSLARSILPLAEQRTTLLSRTLLLWAARGVATEALLDVVATIGGPSPMPPLDNVMILGHSSGRDMLTGVLLACLALTRWEEVFGSAVDPSREHLSRLN